MIKKIVTVIALMLMLVGLASAECYKERKLERGLEHVDLTYDEFKTEIKAIAQFPDRYTFNFVKGWAFMLRDKSTETKYWAIKDDFIRMLQSDASLRRLWREKIDRDEFFKLATTDESYILACKIAKAAEEE